MIHSDKFDKPHDSIEAVRFRRSPELVRKAAVGALAVLAVFTTVSCGAETTKPTTPEMSRQYSVKTDGVTLNVEKQGNPDAKKVVIGIHGGPGLSLESLDLLQPLAGPDQQLVRYDQRGAGISTAPANGNYSLDQQLADLDAVRVSTGADKVDLIGESWGGLLATAYAAEYPAHVDDLVLLDAIPLDYTEFLNGQKRFSQRLATLQESGDVPSPLPTSINNSCIAPLTAVLPAYVAKPSNPVPKDIGSCTADVSKDSYAAITKPGLLAAYAADLTNFNGDALVIAGNDDPFGKQWPDRIVSLLKNANTQQVDIQGAGHLVLFEKRDEVISDIDHFLKK